MPKLIPQVLLLTFGLSSSVSACPFCESSTADQVRAGIFNSDFAYHLGVSFAPFSVLIAILIVIYYWPAGRSRRTTLESSNPEQDLKSISEYV